MKLRSKITKTRPRLAARPLSLDKVGATLAQGTQSFLLLSLCLLGLVASKPAAAATPATSATQNQFGFPHWYQDGTGTRVEACLDKDDAVHCTVLPTPGVFDPTLDIVFPTNFPDEFFYSVVDSDRLTTPGCPGAANPLASAPGKALFRFALEGAFVNELPAFNEQMVFGRTRLSVRGGLCPGRTYVAKHPYGQFSFVADADGSLKPSPGTTDVGCVPLAPQLCDFTLAQNSAELTTGLLRWDPAVAPAADPGYLGGDVAVLHPIVGGVGGFNRVEIIDSNAPSEAPPVVATNLFTVSGKLAGPLLSSATTVDFGGVNAGDAAAVPPTVSDTSPVKKVTLKNIWRVNDAGSTFTITAITKVGPHTDDFAVTTNGCNAVPTAVDAEGSCDIEVTFTPTGLGPRSATLQVTYNDASGVPGLRSPLAIALAGRGQNSTDTAVISMDKTDLEFGQVRVNVTSDPQLLTVTNTGNRTLTIETTKFVNSGSAPVGSTFDSSVFALTTNTCVNAVVQPNGTCLLAVTFTPKHPEIYAAALEIDGRIGGQPTHVTLNAEGIGGKAAVSPAVNPVTGFPMWYQDEEGKRLGECIDPFDPLCIVLPDDFFRGGAIQGLVPDPGTDFVNFPSEYFYYLAETDLIPTSGCGNASPPGNAFIRFADEAAFTNEGPVDGDQMVFGRIRIVATSGLCPETAYKFTHPYGQTVVTTDAAGGIRRNAATSDVGCFPVAPDRCEFAQALQSPILGGFLRQVNAPAGYLGDPAVAGAVTGAPFKLNGNPVNFVRIEKVNTDGSLEPVGETDQFFVMGKLVGPIVADPSSVDFGRVPVGTPSNVRKIEFINEGDDPITTSAINAVGLTGDNIASFAIASTTCDGVTLAKNDKCAVDVSFIPTMTGVQQAAVRLTHSGLNSPTPANLVGLGEAAANKPGISVHPATLSFTDLHLGQFSASESLRVSNAGGNAPLLISQVAVVGANGAATTEFEVVAEQSSCLFTRQADGSLATAPPVEPEAECRISVRFHPQTTGMRTANLVISNNTDAPTNELHIPLSGRGSAAVPRDSGVTVNGFQTWYQDDNGIRVEPCLSGSAPQDPNCVVLPDDTFNPANPVVFPTNYPMEFFYHLADSDIVTIADDACGASGGTAQLRLAIEGTFTSAQPQAGTQTQFSRLRITAQGLCPNTSYTFETPWGQVSRNTNGDGAIPANQGTIDTDNVLADAVGLEGGPLSKGLLRWDPNASPAAPAGYLGDARTLHTVVGSRYRIGTEIDPVNAFIVKNEAGEELGETDLFTVSGRLAGPVVTDPSSVQFPATPFGQASIATTVTVTNIGSDDVTGLTATLNGTHQDQFQIVPGGTCQDTTVLSTDQFCTFAVQFTPTGTTAADAGARTASLQIAHGGPRSPIVVGLSGTALNPAIPHITLSPASIAFNPQDVNLTTGFQERVVSVSNSGDAGSSLIIPAGGITVTTSNGGASLDFSVIGTTCPVGVQDLNGTSVGVPANAPCNVTVRFKPAASGAKTANLLIASNDPLRSTPAVVTLTGTGIAAVATLSPTTLSFSTKGTSTKSFSITNTGTAPLSLVGAPALVITMTSTADSPNVQPRIIDTIKFSASNQNCNNVAPARSCSVSVTFTPGAGVNNRIYTANLLIKTNATNSSPALATGQFNLSLSGTRK